MEPSGCADEADTNYLDALEYFEDVGVVELLDNLDALLGGPQETNPTPAEPSGKGQPPPSPAVEVRLPTPTGAPPLISDISDQGVSDAHDVYDQFDIGEVDLRLFHRVWGPRQVLLRDKSAFLVGTTLLWASSYWLGRSPGTFWQLYSVGALVLLGSRVLLYRSRKWHYYLFDFCYFANVLLLVHVWLAPKSRVLQMVTFGYNSGPLAWSILTFRNSLVFHDLDKVTSLYLHMMPFAVSWSLRWFSDSTRFPPVDDGATWWDLVVLPLSFYCVWMVAYYLKVFVVSAAKIEKKGYKTLFNYVTSAKKGTFRTIASRIPRRLQPVVYLGLHATFSATTLMLAVACWHSFMVHTLMLIGIFTQAIWHGASFYFEIFAKKYATQHPQQAQTPSRRPSNDSAVTPSPRPPRAPQLDAPGAAGASQEGAVKDVCSVGLCRPDCLRLGAPCCALDGGGQQPPTAVQTMCVDCRCASTCRCQFG